MRAVERALPSPSIQAADRGDSPAQGCHHGRSESAAPDSAQAWLAGADAVAGVCPLAGWPLRISAAGGGAAGVQQAEAAEHQHDGARDERGDRGDAGDRAHGAWNLLRRQTSLQALSLEPAGQRGHRCGKFGHESQLALRQVRKGGPLEGGNASRRISA